MSYEEGKRLENRDLPTFKANTVPEFNAVDALIKRKRMKISNKGSKNASEAVL